MHRLERATRQALRALGVPPEARILVACSGGADSVVLARLLHALGHPLVLAHQNYGLRGSESDADAAFVRDLAAQLGAAHVDIRTDAQAYAAAHGVSVQVAARRLRYRWLAQQCGQFTCHSIATAHHRDDVAETVLLHLARGRGQRVLNGIPARHGRVVRPLLHVARAQLRAYLAEIGQSWREDASNATDDYDRNRLRHHVLPALRALHPRVEAQLAARQALYQRQLMWLQSQLELLVPDFWHPRTDGSVHLALRVLLATQGRDTAELLLPYLAETRLGVQPRQAERLPALLDAEPGKQLQVSGWVATRTADELVFAPASAPAAVPPPAELHLPAGSLRWGSIHLRWEVLPAEQMALPPPEHTVYLDAEALAAAGTLHVRAWTHGDRIRPLGMMGSKLVSDVLNERAVPLADRPRQFVLASAGHVWYVQDYRIAAEAALTADTRHVLVLWVGTAAADLTPDAATADAAG